MIAFDVKEKKFLAFRIVTYDGDGRVNAERADDGAAYDGHRVAGPSEGVRQEKYAGADRALQQMHEHGEISVTILSSYHECKFPACLPIPITRRL